MGFLGKLTKKMDKIVSKVKNDDKPADRPASSAGTVTKASAVGTSSKPVNHGNGWSPEEERRLKAGYNGGATIDDLSIAHGRSSNAIAHRLIKLGYSDVEAPA